MKFRSLLSVVALTTSMVFAQSERKLFRLSMRPIHYSLFAGYQSGRICLLCADPK
jgi:hypothetical protein